MHAEVTGYRRRRNLLVVALLVLLIAETWWFGTRALRVPEPIMTVGDIALLSPRVVCPGDVMRFQYSFTAAEPGVLAINTTIRGENGVTLLSLPRKEVVVERPMTLVIEQAWQVPLVYEAVHGGRQSFQQGDYIRIVAFTSIGEHREPLIRQTEFTIGACSFDAGEEGK